MPMSGPAPKRDVERHRRVGPTVPTEEVDVTSTGLPFEIDLSPTPPDPIEGWHPVVRDLWNSLLTDPCRLWMGPTDWHLARLMMEAVSRELNPVIIGWNESRKDGKLWRTPIMGVKSMSGQGLGSLMRWAKMTGITEDARMALRKQVDLNQPEIEAQMADNVTSITKNRDDLFR